MTAPERALAALRAAAVERMTEMEADAAAEWLVGQGLLSVARDARLALRLRELLAGRLKEVAARNLFLAAQLGEVVAALDGIPVCPLKGIYLLETIYRCDPECRVLRDLDLLVPEGRVDEAVERLEGAGFAESPSSRRLRGATAERSLERAGVVVEVHGRLGIKHGWPSAWEDVAPWPEARPGGASWVLDRETTLVHLVCHFVKHRPFSRLVWAEDVLRWIGRGVDAPRALARARDLGAERSFLAGLRILGRALGPLGLPAVEASAGPAGRLAVWLNERLLWRGLAERPAAAGEGRPAGRTVSALLLADGMADRARFLRAKLAEVRRR